MKQIMLYSHILCLWVRLLPLHWSNQFFSWCLLVWAVPSCWHWYLLTFHKVHKVQRFIMSTPSNMLATKLIVPTMQSHFLSSCDSYAVLHMDTVVTGLRASIVLRLILLFSLLLISQPAVWPASSELHWIVESCDVWKCTILLHCGLGIGQNSVANSV